MSYQVVIRFGTDGWRRETVLLDEFQGKRDITDACAARRYTSEKGVSVMKREKTAIEVGQVWRDKRECAKQGWMPDHVADAILEEAGIDADKELQRAMDTVARYEAVNVGEANRVRACLDCGEPGEVLP